MVPAPDLDLTRDALASSTLSHGLHRGLAVAGQDLALDRSTNRHGFIRVDVAARFFAEELFDLVLNLGHAGHAAHQNDVVNLINTDAGIFDGHSARCDGALNQLVDQGLELGAVEFDAQVLWPRGIGSNVG